MGGRIVRAFLMVFAVVPRAQVAKYNLANREVAILCNHQKTVSKAAETTLENLHEKLATMKEQRNQLVEWRELAKKKKDDKIPLKRTRLAPKRSTAKPASA